MKELPVQNFFKNVTSIDEPSVTKNSHLFITKTPEGKEVSRIQFRNGARNDPNAIDGICEDEVYDILLNRMEGFASIKADEYNLESIKLVKRLKEIYADRRKPKA